MRLDRHVAADQRIGGKKHRFRRDHRRASRHGGAAQARLRDGFGLSELDAVVDAEHFAFVGDDNFCVASVGARQFHHIGEIELALGVLVVDPFEQSQRVGAVDRHQTAIAQRNRAFFVAGVLFLADCDEAPGGVAQQPSVAEGV